MSEQTTEATATTTPSDGAVEVTVTGGGLPPTSEGVGVAAPAPTSEDAEIAADLGDAGDEGDDPGDETDPEDDELEGAEPDDEEPPAAEGDEPDLQAVLDAAHAELQLALQQGGAGDDGDGAEAPPPPAESGEPPSLVIDPDQFQYESERTLASIVNLQAAAIEELRGRFEQMSGIQERVEQAELRQVAEQAVSAMTGGAEAILAEYGVNVKPEYLGALMRKHADVVRAYGRFDPKVAVEVFEREHYRQLLAAKGRPGKAPAQRANTLAGGGGARLGGRAASLSEDDMIARDLQGVPY